MAAASTSGAQVEPEMKALPDEVVAVIGDVGGTNVRLTLRRLCLKTRTSTEIKALTKISSQETKNFSEALGQFLAVSLRLISIFSIVNSLADSNES